MFNEFMTQYGMNIIYTILMAVIGYAGIVVKNLYAKYVDNIVKADVVKTCVKAVEQIYVDIHGEDKLKECLKHATAILEEKGISVSDTEINMLVEAAVHEMNTKVGELLVGEAIFEDEEDIKG